MHRIPRRCRSLDSRIESLVRLDEDAVCLLPSAFAADIRGADQVEVRSGARRGVRDLSLLCLPLAPSSR